MNVLGRLCAAASLALVVTLGHAAETVNDDTQKRVAYAEAYKTLQVLRAVADSGGMPPDAYPVILTTPKATGPYGEFERFVKIMASQSIARDRAYMIDVIGSGFPELLAGSRLQADASLMQSWQILDKGRRAMDRHSAIAANWSKDLFVQIDALKLSDDDKNLLRQGLKTQQPIIDSNYQQRWATDAAVLVEYKGMISTLSDARGRWRIGADDAIEFARDDELARYQKHQQTIMRLSEQSPTAPTDSMANLLSPLQP